MARRAEKIDAAQMPARAAVLTALLEGLGDATDGSLSALLLSGNLAPQSAMMPHPALWLGRDGAASAGAAARRRCSCWLRWRRTALRARRRRP